MKKKVKHMQVILLKDISGVGKIGQSKEVKPGFARNFLFPNNLAALTSDERAVKLSQEFKNKKQEGLKKNQETTQNLVSLTDKKIIFKVKVNKQGIPYKTIQSKDVAVKLGVDKDKIVMKPLKKIGENKVKIKTGDVEQEIVIVLEKE
ncbi:MAG: ribosomal protein [Candidatus Berkelbacteria bacterium]|nr:ribosomal protein [Candidatus Berkelbacteria bacterium]